MDSSSTPVMSPGMEKFPPEGETIVREITIFAGLVK
jgi:hypothetical protein